MLKEIVQRAGLYMDRNYPGWATRIKKDRLDMVNPCNCIAGQGAECAWECGTSSPTIFRRMVEYCCGNRPWEPDMELGPAFRLFACVQEGQSWAPMWSENHKLHDLWLTEINARLLSPHEFPQGEPSQGPGEPAAVGQSEQSVLCGV